MEAIALGEQGLKILRAGYNTTLIEARGHGPPTCFIPLSCAENWWPVLRRILEQLETRSGDTLQATKLRSGDSNAMIKSAQRYPGFVNQFYIIEGGLNSLPAGGKVTYI